MLTLTSPKQILVFKSSCTKLHLMGERKYDIPSHVCIQKIQILIPSNINVILCFFISNRENDIQQIRKKNGKHNT